MRPSSSLFNAVKSGVKVASDDIDYFAKLPVKLQAFFTRYPPVQFKTYSTKPTSTDAEDANPFLPNRHPVTNKTHNPKYSMRRQSDLWKLAYRFGVEDQLPVLQNNKIFYQEKYDANQFMKRTLRPKLARYERNKEERKQKTKDALAKADETILAVKGNKYKRLMERRAKEGKSWI